MYSSKNPNTTTAAMQAVILDVEMPKDGKVIAEFNGKKFEHTLGELLEGSRSHFMIGWLSEAILFNRAMPESCFTLEHYMEDKEPAAGYGLLLCTRSPTWRTMGLEFTDLGGKSVVFKY